MSLKFCILTVILCGACGFPFKCPPPSHRHLRAKVICPNPATYLCLHDDIRGGFSENCSRVTLEQPGKVTTLNYNGNFDNRPCSSNLYQPRYIPYWTNVSTDCIYQKSSCSEEGQEGYQNGGLNSDRTCTCDHTTGYTFVRRPSNPCFCKPLTEDCSCYNAMRLNTSHIWSTDSQCESILPALVPGKPSRDVSIATTTQLPGVHLKEESFRYDTGTRTYNKKLIIGVILIIVIVLAILSILLYFSTTIVECCWCKLDQFANRYIFAAFVMRPSPDIIERFEGESCSLECELSSPGAACLKDNYENTRCWQITKTQTGYTYTLTINQLTTNHNAIYTLRNENGHVISQTVIDCRQMPKEIQKMPKKDRDAFLKAVTEGGRASRLFIRIMLVGKSGAGKTSLLKLLLEENVDISKIQSTDGVNIEIRNCRINLQTKEWIYSLEPNKTIQEILKDDTSDIAYCGFWDFAGQKEFYATHQTFLTPNAIYLLVVDISEDFKGKTVEKNIESEAVNMGEPNKTIQEILKDDTSDIAYCGFWDFAGQKEFYATHQTFLTPNAIYLLVVDISEDFKGKTVEKNIESEAVNMGDYIDFWIDNIHCYATDDLVTYGMREKHLRPPILLVGTCIDKINKDDVQSVKETFMQYLDTFISRKSRKWQHIIGEKVSLVSNANPKMKFSSHQEIKDKIVDFAMNTNPTTLPVQWILMEKVLAQISNSYDTVISYDEVRIIAKDKQLSDLDIFLRYEHEIGNIIFLEDVKDFIILDQQWLVDAFRCLVGSEDFIISYKSIIDGKCSKDQIKHCLTKCPDRHFEEKVEFLIKIFEQFDILVRPQTDNGRTDNYYIPCMMSSQSSEDLWNNYGGKDEGYVKTSWLCIDLEFLPPALFNHILAMYIQSYPTVFDSGKPSFSKNAGTFYIDENGFYRLIICKSFNSIALQVIEDKNNQLCYWQYREELLLMVKKVFNRYKMRSTYWLKLKCSDGSPHSGIGKHAIPIIKKFNENNIGDASTLYGSWFGKRTKIKMLPKSWKLYFDWSFENVVRKKSRMELPQILHAVKTISRSDFSQIVPFFQDHSQDDYGQQERTCEFCSDQRVFFCEKCQQDMCCECFDVHKSTDKGQSHRGVIYEKFVLERTIVVGVSSYTDMVVLPDGLLVLVDNSGGLLTFDIDGENHKPKPLFCFSNLQLVSLTVIDNNNVAVLHVNSVLIADMRRLLVIRKVTLKPNCSGIVFIENMLYVGREEENSSTIQVLDIAELQVQKTIPLSCIPQCLRYGNNGRIYCLTDTRVIVIYGMNWNELCTLKDLNIPKTVANITVDNDGNALVLSDNFNGCVINITPDGKAVPLQSLEKQIHLFSLDLLSFHTESRMLFYSLRNKISIYKMKE